MKVNGLKGIALVSALLIVVLAIGMGTMLQPASVAAASQDTPEYHYKTFPFVGAMEGSQLDKAMATIEKWLKDNKVKEHDFETAGNVSVLYITIRYKK